MRNVIFCFLLLLLPLSAFSASYIDIGVFNGHTYQYCNNAITWSAARDDCFSRGGYLACVTSPEEQAFLETALPTDMYWIGGSDEAIEGVWTWVSGEPFIYTRWGYDSPNEVPGNTFDYITLSTDYSYFGWRDLDGTFAFYYLLELPYLLPVEMTSFSATGLDNSVNLRWRTETESNNSHFNLYRSTVEGDRGELLTRIEGHGTTANANEYSYTDTRVVNGTTYYYRIADVSFDGEENMNRFVVSAMPAPHALGEIPYKYHLSQNYPNPFNPSTEITYGLHKASHVRLTVFNELGKEVAMLVNGYQTANTYRIQFNADGLPSGTYYYTLRTNGFTTTKKMVLTK